MKTSLSVFSLRKMCLNVCSEIKVTYIKIYINGHHVHNNNMFECIQSLGKICLGSKITLTDIKIWCLNLSVSLDRIPREYAAK